MPFAARKPGSADILYVMALDNEYGPHLKSRITPLMTGVGPVEALPDPESIVHHLKN